MLNVASEIHVDNQHLAKTTFGIFHKPNANGDGTTVPLGVCGADSSLKSPRTYKPSLHLLFIKDEKAAVI